MRRFVVSICAVAAIAAGGVAVTGGTALAAVPHPGCGPHHHWDGHHCVIDAPAHAATWFHPPLWLHSIFNRFHHPAARHHPGAPIHGGHHA
jgi:hypothetical protein